MVALCKNYTTSSHAPTSHAPSSHAPSSHAHKPPSDQQSDPNPPPTSYSGTSTLPTSGMQQARIYIQSSFYSFIVCLGKSMLRPIIILFFYRLFRKVYAMSNGMYLFLPIDRFLRMRSRNLLMYLDPLVSLRFSSFELASYTTIFCSVPVVPILSHVPKSTLLTLYMKKRVLDDEGEDIELGEHPTFGVGLGM